MFHDLCCVLLLETSQNMLHITPAWETLDPAFGGGPDAPVVSYSVRPHRQQPMRLPHPWDSPGKNTGVGCHFLLQCMKVKVKVKSLSRVWLLVTPWTAAHQAPPSMGFSRQECWSGVPLLVPVNSSFLYNLIQANIISHLESWAAFCLSAPTPMPRSILHLAEELF